LGNTRKLLEILKSIKDEGVKYKAFKMVLNEMAKSNEDDRVIGIIKEIMDK
jgi:hypothetical protein